MHVGLGTSLTFLMGQRLWRSCCISKQMFKKVTWIGICRLCHCSLLKRKAFLAPTITYSYYYLLPCFGPQVLPYGEISIAGCANMWKWREKAWWILPHHSQNRHQTSLFILGSAKIQCGLIWHSVPATKMEKIPVKSHLKHMKHIHTTQYNSNWTHAAVTKFS